MYSVLSLFAGIGGFDLGLERTGGFKTVAFCEIDPFCQRVLAKHWPEVPCYDDVRELTAERLTADGIEPDCIVGGFPCQDISYAGEGAGIGGKRSGLWSEFARLIGELRPRIVIVENVGALLVRGLDVVLGSLASFGYDAQWHCIPAAAVGAPHRRDRVWLVAHPGSEQHEGRGLALERALASQLSSASADAEGMFWAEIERREQNGNPAGGGEVADPDIERTQVSEAGELAAIEVSWRDGGDGHVAHADGHARDQCRAGDASEGARGRDAGGSRLGSHVADPEVFPIGSGLRQNETPGERWRRLGYRSSAEGQWATEPNVGRVAHGVPSRVDRLRCLGNAVVPQIPELIGRAILEAEAA